MKKIILFCISWIVFSLNLTAQDIYVTPNGTAIQSEPDAGMQSNPYNLDDVVNLINFGLIDVDTLFLEGHFERSVSIFIIGIADLTIRSFGAESAIISS